MESRPRWSPGGPPGLAGKSIRLDHLGPYVGRAYSLAPDTASARNRRQHPRARHPRGPHKRSLGQQHRGHPRPTAAATTEVLSLNRGSRNSASSEEGLTPSMTSTATYSSGPWAPSPSPTSSCTRSGTRPSREPDARPNSTASPSSACPPSSLGTAASSMSSCSVTIPPDSISCLHSDGSPTDTHLPLFQAPSSRLVPRPSNNPPAGRNHSSELRHARPSAAPSALTPPPLPITPLIPHFTSPCRPG